jgi:ABC-type microcin C transport system permease subunit YejB
MFQEKKMATNTDSNTGMRSEIQKKWSKFTYQEVSALKNKDDLVAQLQAKYGFDKAQAQRDVDAFANGRQL